MGVEGAGGRRDQLDSESRRLQRRGQLGTGTAHTSGRAAGGERSAGACVTALRGLLQCSCWGHAGRADSVAMTEGENGSGSVVWAWAGSEVCCSTPGLNSQTDAINNVQASDAPGQSQRVARGESFSLTKELGHEIGKSETAGE